VRLAPLGLPARAQRCRFLFIVASSASVRTAAGSASVRTAAGSASSTGGCAEDAPHLEGPAPLEPGGTCLMDRQICASVGCDESK
jgi:hypothetical protein